MHKSMIILISLFLITIRCYASPHDTVRIPQISNSEVNVWETLIYPNKNQVLKMHRHEYNRVVIALNNGLLKITNNKGKVEYLKLVKNHAYYLAKNIPGELHMDENVSPQLVKVFVIELKKS